MKRPAILFVAGASGVGKTASVRALESRSIRGVRCYYFDDIGIPTDAEVEREHGNWERWQANSTRKWIERLHSNADGAEVAVLEGQTRLSFVSAAFVLTGVATSSHAVLLDCQADVRKARLEARGHGNLATAQMESWSAYLFGQGEALMLPVLDTSELTIDQVVDFLARQVEALRSLVQALR